MGNEMKRNDSDEQFDRRLKEKECDHGKSSRLNIVIHRILCSDSWILRPLQILTRIILHLEIPQKHFKNGLCIFHPYNIIMHPDTKIGSNVTIYHNVTIATVWSGIKKGTPVIEDNVIIYPHSVLLGHLTIGRNSIVGAGSIVIHDVPSGCIAAGNPAKVVGNVTDNRPIEIRRYY